MRGSFDRRGNNRIAECEWKSSGKTETVLQVPFSGVKIILLGFKDDESAVQSASIQQKMDNKADILLDLSHVPDLPSLGEESDHLNSDQINAYCHGSLIDLRETHSRTDVLKMKGRLRSEKELGIRRDLEEEIKEGIYQHALRLHRLYRQQKERKNKTLLEVNISIRMEGGAKIEIKETKKDHGHDHDHERGRVPRTASARSENMMQLAAVPQVNANTKKFDWVKSLRSNAGPVRNLQYQAKTLRTNRCCYLNLDGLNNGRRVCSASTSSNSEKPAGQGLRKR
ncbi:hypothetical protein F2P56_026588 [Juglans regia]|uniref:Uncharacterized protein LOC108998244 n=2 Tax=Juglans regia TaxID=51240 RepID=A0A2I4FF62_JUGRE|nr:uncharacterized protein LOC108998244 [Juglans regia]KAF5451482.1 hypothetical protein F2P56_026588 [Juglans regia]